MSVATTSPAAPGRHHLLAGPGQVGQGIALFLPDHRARRNPQQQVFPVFPMLVLAPSVLTLPGPVVLLVLVIDQSAQIGIDYQRHVAAPAAVAAVWSAVGNEFLTPERG